MVAAGFDLDRIVRNLHRELAGFGVVYRPRRVLPLAAVLIVLALSIGAACALYPLLDTEPAAFISEQGQ